MEGSRAEKEKKFPLFLDISEPIDSISDSKGVMVKVIYDLNKIDFDSMINIAFGLYVK